MSRQLFQFYTDSFEAVKYYLSYVSEEVPTEFVVSMFYLLYKALEVFELWTLNLLLKKRWKQRVRGYKIYS